MSIIEVLVTSTLVSGLVASVIGLLRDKNLEKFKNELRSAALAARFLRIEGIEDINEELRATRREKLDKVMEQLPEAEEKLEDSLREILGAELEN